MYSIVFDMDGVIFDTELLSRRVWMELAPRYGIYNMECLYPQMVGVNKEGIYLILKASQGEEFPAERLYREVQQRMQYIETTEGISFKKGAEELFAFLKKKRAVVGIASSSDYDVIEHNLKISGIYSNFHGIVGGDQVKKSKPEPDIYRKACEKLELISNTVFAVEDSYNGVRSASRAGMKTIMVPDLQPVTEEMREITEVILPDLLAVRDYLDKQWN